MAKIDCVEVSATNGTGLDILREKLVDLAYSGKVGTTDVDVTINERQKALLESSNKILDRMYLIYLTQTAT